VPNPDAVRAELERVLASHEFRSSRRSQEFLLYIVEHALAGDTDQLKERTIGIDVFGRSPSYDPSDDATVRVKAGEVRKRLGLYYAKEGAGDPLRIELPGGAYVPEFHLNTAYAGAAPLAPVPAGGPGAAPTVRPSGRYLNRVAMGVTLLVVVAIAGGLYWRSRPPASTLELFWAPVVHSPTPASICAAFVPVYSLGDRDPNNPAPPRADEFVFLPDQFVGGGDMLAVSRVASMLSRLHSPYQLRIGESVSFYDMRTSPAILVGYSYTKWREISRQMRYFIDTTRRPIGITDNGAPTLWALPHLPANRQTNEDYAIVSRVFHPDTHAMLVEIAGITQYGTEAAADLVTNNDLLPRRYARRRTTGRIAISSSCSM
jgi:hypothetical protein